MWHLYENLRAFNPVANIQDGSCCLQNVRVLSGEEQDIFPDYAYLVGITPLFGWKVEQEDILIISQKDILILHHADFYSLLNELMNIFDNFRSLGNKLSVASESEDPYKDILDIIESYYHLPMCMIDNNLKILAITESISYMDLWENIDKYSHMPEGFLSVFDNSENNRKFFTCKDPFLMNPVNSAASQLYRKLLVIPFQIRQVVVGKLLINLFQDEVSEGDLLMGEIFSDYLCHATAKLYSRNPHRTDNYLIRSIKENFYSEEEEKVFYYANSWEKTDYFRLYVFQESSLRLKEVDLRWYCGLFELNLDNIFVFSMDNQILLLSPSQKDVSQKIQSVFRSNHQKFFFHCGSSIPFSGLRHLGIYYRQALAASDHACKTRACSVSFDEICCDALIREIHAGFCWQPWIPQELWYLKQYDQDNHTEYMHTLYQYLLHNESVTETAQVLNIHPSSLKYRLKKLEDLIQFCKGQDYYHKYIWFCLKFLNVQ